MQIAVANLKGGAGKSTLAVNLAAGLAELGRAVVVVDADAQGTACAWLASGGGVRAVALPLEDARGAERWIRRVLELGADRDVVVDTPPHLSTATAAALTVADLAVVPVTASGADLLATAKALDLVREARVARGGGGLPRCLVVPSRIDRRTAAGREIDAALAAFGEPVGPPIGQRSAFVDAFTAGESVLTFAPASKAAGEVRELTAAVISAATGAVPTLKKPEIQRRR